MTERRENRVPAKFLRADRAVREHSRVLRALDVPGAASALLLAALCVVPAALAQGQAGAAAPAATKPQASGPSANSGSSSGASSSAAAAATQTSAASQNAASASSTSPAEPQIQDQSAPAPESLGEIARRSRAQKTKSAAGGPKVYTDDRLSQLSGHGVSVVGDGNAGGAGSSGAENSFASSGENSGGTGGASGGKTDEQYWRGRARTIRDQMAQCDQQISKLQDEIAQYGAVSVDPQSGVQAGIIYINDRNAQIKQIEERKAGLQGQLDALEDEGRKAGADSGWFR